MSYAEIMAEMYALHDVAVKAVLICGAIGFLLDGPIGFIVGALVPLFIIPTGADPKMVEALAQLPYQQEKTAIIAEATHINCCLYRDEQGNYFFRHKFKISDRDHDENGPKFIRVDISEEEAVTIMAEMSLLADNHDCNIHYDFTPFEEAVRSQYLAEHPTMADDYDGPPEEDVTVITGATKVYRNLYMKNGQYFMVDDELTTRTDVSEEEAAAYVESHNPQYIRG